MLTVGSPMRYGIQPGILAADGASCDRCVEGIVNGRCCSEKANCVTGPSICEESIMKPDANERSRTTFCDWVNGAIIGDGASSVCCEGGADLCADCAPTSTRWGECFAQEGFI